MVHRKLLLGFKWSKDWYKLDTHYKLNREDDNVKLFFNNSLRALSAASNSDSHVVYGIE